MKAELQLQPPAIEANPSDTDPLLQNQSDSTEIRDEQDIEASSLPCCRICLESDGEPGDDLISPCMCKGTQQFVHRFCLDHWRSVKEGFAFSHCTTCKAQFHFQVERLEDYSWRKIKFRIFVARDVLLVFLAVQTGHGTLISGYIPNVCVLLAPNITCYLLHINITPGPAIFVKTIPIHSFILVSTTTKSSGSVGPKPESTTATKLKWEVSRAFRDTPEADSLVEGLGQVVWRVWSWRAAPGTGWRGKSGGHYPGVLACAGGPSPCLGAGYELGRTLGLPAHRWLLSGLPRGRGQW